MGELLQIGANVKHASVNIQHARQSDQDASHDTPEARAAARVEAEKQATDHKVWLAKLATLSPTEAAVFHWYVTSNCGWKQTCRELGLKRWEFDGLIRSIGQKLGVGPGVVKLERAAA